MTNALTKAAPASVPALKMNEDELIEVLQGSLYPGAMVGSVKLVINYCKASGLDPMQKPVHIVPMWDKASKSMRDVVMPGIGLYRTQAARSGEYAGVSEPEFGPDITEDVGGAAMTYPAWCRVTVRRLLQNGTVVEFTAKELWKENYATASKDSIAPNTMWRKRPYGQLAKCTEAQALRKAFPEFGAQPTADEMEGKEIDMGAAEVVPPRNATPAPLPPYPDGQFEENLPAWRAGIAEGRLTAEKIIARVSSKYVMSEAQRTALRENAEPKAADDDGVIDAEFVADHEGAQQ